MPSSFLFQGMVSAVVDGQRYKLRHQFHIVVLRNGEDRITSEEFTFTPIGQ